MQLKSLFPFRVRVALRMMIPESSPRFRMWKGAPAKMLFHSNCARLLLFERAGLSQKLLEVSRSLRFAQEAEMSRLGERERKQAAAAFGLVSLLLQLIGRRRLRCTCAEGKEFGTIRLLLQDGRGVNGRDRKRFLPRENDPRV